MEKSSKNGTEAQGADVQEVPGTISRQDIGKFVKRDIGFAFDCLRAIVSDPDMMESLADFMYGRYLNAQQAKLNAEQRKLEQQ